MNEIGLCFLNGDGIGCVGVGVAQVVCWCSVGVVLVLLVVPQLPVVPGRWGDGNGGAVVVHAAASTVFYCVQSNCRRLVDTVTI